jgi:hypothetical protein
MELEGGLEEAGEMHRRVHGQEADGCSVGSGIGYGEEGDCEVRVLCRMVYLLSLAILSSTATTD